MTSLSRALETLKASLGEVRSTLASRTAQVDGIAAVVPIMMPHLAGHAYERTKFQAALQSRRTALDSFHRGLFIVSVSYFEGFVKMSISALVQMKSAGASKFSDLPETFRQQYVIRASQVLANVGSGSVKGIPYNFSALQRNVGICFSDTGRPPLDGDVFTILMGNPTWNRLKALFESLGIADPFDQSFGSNTHIRGWGKAAWKKNLSDAEAKLDALLDRRNLIVHAAQPVTIVEQDIVDACDFFEAVASGLVDEMPGRL
jgi:hypothetical protein